MSLEGMGNLQEEEPDSDNERGPKRELGDLAKDLTESVHELATATQELEETLQNE